MADRSEAVLITGCSSGIGRATAERLAGRGLPVYATARRPDTIADLGSTGCTVLALDVCDEGSMAAAVERVERDHGLVGALVNNAGYGEYGAVEAVPPERARRQLETNVLGPMRLAQLALPKMREQGRGTIVNIGSMGGRMTFPGGGWYHASKYALEALSAALRFEVAPFGVRVVLVEPGLIHTGFDDAALTAMSGSSAPAGPYAPLDAAVEHQIHAAYSGAMGRLGGGPEKVAKVVDRALRARRPKPRYKVTPSARVSIGLRRLTSDRMWDALMRSQFKVPKTPKAPV